MQFAALSSIATTHCRCTPAWWLAALLCMLRQPSAPSPSLVASRHSAEASCRPAYVAPAAPQHGPAGHDWLGGHDERHYGGCRDNQSRAGFLDRQQSGRLHYKHHQRSHAARLWRGLPELHRETGAVGESVTGSGHAAPAERALRASEVLAMCNSTASHPRCMCPASPPSRPVPPASAAAVRPQTFTYNATTGLPEAVIFDTQYTFLNIPIPGGLTLMNFTLSLKPWVVEPSTQYAVTFTSSAPGTQNYNFSTGSGAGSPVLATGWYSLGAYQQGKNRCAAAAATVAAARHRTWRLADAAGQAVPRAPDLPLAPACTLRHAASAGTWSKSSADVLIIAIDGIDRRQAPCLGSGVLPLAGGQSRLGCRGLAMAHASAHDRMVGVAVWLWAVQQQPGCWATLMCITCFTRNLRSFPPPSPSPPPPPPSPPSPPVSVAGTVLLPRWWRSGLLPIPTAF